MTLRDEIARNIGGVYRMGAMQERGEPHYYSPYSEADAILVKVREALIGDEAVEAMAFHLFGTNGMAFISETKRKIVRDNITAALDAVTGEDDER